MQNSNDIQANKAVLKHSHVISVCVRMLSGKQVAQRLRHLWICIICLRMENCAYPIGIPLASHPTLSWLPLSLRQILQEPPRTALPSHAHQASSYKVNVPHTDSFLTFSPFRLQSGEKLRKSSACPKCALLKTGITNTRCLQCLSVSTKMMSNFSIPWLHFVSSYNLHL